LEGHTIDEISKETCVSKVFVEKIVDKYKRHKQKAKEPLRDGLHHDEPIDLSVGMVIPSLIMKGRHIVVIDATIGVIIAIEPTLPSAISKINTSVKFDLSTVYKRIRDNDVSPVKGYIFGTHDTISEKFKLAKGGN
jgi:hypothetical protein